MPRRATPREGATFVFWRLRYYEDRESVLRHDGNRIAVSSKVLRALSEDLGGHGHVCGLCPAWDSRDWCEVCGSGGVYVGNHLLPVLAMRDAQQGGDDA